MHKKSPSITNVILRTNKIRVTTRIQTVSALIASYHSHVYDNGDLRQRFSVKDFLPCCSRTGSDCILLRPCTNRPFSDSYKVLLFPFIAFEYILSQSSCLVHKKSVKSKPPAELVVISTQNKGRRFLRPEVFNSVHPVPGLLPAVQPSLHFPLLLPGQTGHPAFQKYNQRILKERRLLYLPRSWMVKDNLL